MTTYTVRSFKELGTMLEKHAKQRRAAITRAKQKTLKDAAKIVKLAAPVAFGELRDGFDVRLDATGGDLINDSPHVMAVENGSRPHVVPLEALIKWVQLKATQGLSRGQRNQPAAKHIAASLKSMQRGGANQVGDVERIARGIQHGIATHGTKPTHFMAKSLPAIIAAFKKNMETEMHRG